MPTGGFVTYERRLFDPDYLLAGKYGGLEYKAAWLDLIGLATHKPYNGLERGQLRASHSFLVLRWGWSKKRVNTFLRDLEKASMVKRFMHQTGKHIPTVITICNYDIYQTPGRSKETDMETRPEPRTEPRTEPKTTRNKKQETSTSTSLPAVRESTEVEVITNHEMQFVTEPPPNRAVPAILGYWIDQQSVRPGQKEIAKQGQAVKRMVTRHGAYETAEAFVGIQYLYAFREGIFDAFDVERQFTKARQAFHQNEQVVDPGNVDWSWLFQRGG